MATGNFCNWICSDDMLSIDALFYLAPVLSENKNSLVLGKGTRVDRNGAFFNEITPSAIRNLTQLADLRNYWRNSSSIMQQSAFFPLNAAREAGFLNENNHLTMDYELWGRLLSMGVKIIPLYENIGVFRWYEGQKTSRFNAVTDSLVKTAIMLIRENGDLTSAQKLKARRKIMAYHLKYRYHALRSSIGIKKRLGKLLYGNPGTIHK
jgi:hypothetical protein